MKKMIFFLRFLIGIFIIGFLLYKIGFNNVLGNIVDIPFIFVLTSLFIFIISLMIGAVNFWILLNPIRTVKFYKILWYSALSWAMGSYAPGKIGEFSIILLLKKEGITISEGAVISLIDKLITFITLSILSIVGFLILFDIITTIKFAIFLIMLLAIFLIAIISRSIRNLIAKFILRRFASKFEGFFKFFSYYIGNKKGLIFVNFLMTLMKWFFSTSILYVLFLGYNTEVNFWYMLPISSMVILLSLIPLSISGLGIRESVAVFLFSMLGVDSAITVSVYLVQLIMVYILASILLLAGLKHIK